MAVSLAGPRRDRKSPRARLQRVLLIYGLSESPGSPHPLASRPTLHRVAVRVLHPEGLIGSFDQSGFSFHSSWLQTWRTKSERAALRFVTDWLSEESLPASVAE